ncbi:MAG TPA: alpha-galactosidase [Bryobacteraceae bacterium]|nr:alpha-galactosidase [Bryobacteraceae bacterium]
MRVRYIVPALLCVCAFAAEPIRFLPEKKLFIIDAGPVTWVAGINERNELQHVYWGGRVTRDADWNAVHSLPEWASFDLTTTTTPQEYPGQGAGLFTEPCLKITMQDGNRDLVLHYASHKIAGNTLTITLKDISNNVFADVSYTAYPDSGIIRRATLIRNNTNQPLVIENAQSGVWYVPQGTGYRLSYLAGRWAGETQLQHEPVNPGLKVIESRRGATSAQANPWFALDRDASEEHGRVWFGALGWSGSWRISIEETPLHQVRVTGGFNPFDFGYRLKPGESLETPGFYGGYTEGGFGEASRVLHRFERAQILPERSRSRPRPVLYNSWEATTFNVDEAGQRALAEKAASIGVERFVMDDGWFGARDNDRAGLGDWVVNPRKFPNGLKPLIDAVHHSGMDFGLWVEPEMVNPNSDLYRAHPDWVINFAGRPRTEGRHQLVLNLARDDVKEHIFGVLDRLVTDNDIAFLKWDMNRNFSEPGWPEAAPEDQKKIWVAYTRNLYDIIDRLRERHPKLEIESCSGGGGRVDLGMLQRVDEVWTSDNTEAFDRLSIQNGFTHAYTPQVMMAWVTDVPNMNGRSTSLKYRFLVAMNGSLGIGANLNHWSNEDFALARNMVALYKSIRTTVQQGRLYRLIMPPADVVASEYVSDDGAQAVFFAFRHSQQLGEPAAAICLRGLDPNATYRLRRVDGLLLDRGDELSGSYLMNQGLRFNLSGDFAGSAVVLERE